MMDNEFILEYYRADWSIRQAFFSLFKWHNETLDGITSSIMNDLNKHSATDKQFPIVEWPLYVFLTGATTCLILSSTCHLVSCHSHNFNTSLLKLDYPGITTMIITSYFPPMYYIFQSSKSSNSRPFPSPASSPPRSTTSSALWSLFQWGMFGIVLAVHAFAVNWNNVTLAYEGGMALSYLVGALVYVTRVLELFRPDC